MDRSFTKDQLTEIEKILKYIRQMESIVRTSPSAEQKERVRKESVWRYEAEQTRHRRNSAGPNLDHWTETDWREMTTLWSWYADLIAVPGDHGSCLEPPQVGEPLQHHQPPRAPHDLLALQSPGVGVGNEDCVQTRLQRRVDVRLG